MSKHPFNILFCACHLSLVNWFFFFLQHYQSVWAVEADDGAIKINNVDESWHFALSLMDELIFKHQDIDLNTKLFEDPFLSSDTVATNVQKQLLVASVISLEGLLCCNMTLLILQLCLLLPSYVFVWIYVLVKWCPYARCVCVCVQSTPRGVWLLYHGVVDKGICSCDTTNYCCLVSAQNKTVRGLERNGNSALLL